MEPGKNWEQRETFLERHDAKEAGEVQLPVKVKPDGGRITHELQTGTVVGVRVGVTKLLQPLALHELGRVCGELPFLAGNNNKQQQQKFRAKTGKKKFPGSTGVLPKR